MTTKYSVQDLRELAKDIIKTYNKGCSENQLKCRLNADFKIEVSDNHTRLIIMHQELICCVL